jgi:transcriptional regulator with XRE-family HTH domain
MTLGHLLKLIRVSQNIPQHVLADALGVTPNYLSLIEHDKRDPSLRFLRRFRDHLQVPLGAWCLKYLDEY